MIVIGREGQRKPALSNLFLHPRMTKLSPKDKKRAGSQAGMKMK